MRFIKGLPGRITEDADGRPVLHYDNQVHGQRAELTVDLAILAVGLRAPGDLPALTATGPERDVHGFYQGRHPTLHPLESTRPGIFLAGTCQGPQDISETVCQGSAAAARVLRLLRSLTGRNPG